MNGVKGVSDDCLKSTIKFLIEESECAIEECKIYKKKYFDNTELVHMYSIKMLHYEFMICRLKRHLKTTYTPKQWCESFEEHTNDTNN